MQEDVIAYLTSSDWCAGDDPVEVIETHGALIFLAGETALKMKRAVRYDYMDLSTPALREAMVHRELSLNQPGAPQIYRDVVAVTRAPDGSLALDGGGEPVEWVLRMWRFPAANELSVVADAHGIDDTLAQELGDNIFAYHRRCPTRDSEGDQLIEEILEELERVFADMKAPLGAALIDAFHRKCREALAQHAPLLKSRGLAGHVRRCHGDLHLRNIVLIDARPVPFDALEFDEVLGTCDVLYDLAFLIMDLCHRNLRRAANIVLNAYLFSTSGSDDDGLAALPLFLAVRAAIRAMVCVQTASAKGQGPDPEAVRFLERACQFLDPVTPLIVVVGGMSGTGKTTLSRALAPQIGSAPGAVHLRSDLERKVSGRDADVPGADLPDPTLVDYSTAARSAVYDRMFARARRLLATGQAVLLDATFLEPDIREEAQAMANAAGFRMLGLWLEAPLNIAIDRVTAREGDASDADAHVVRAQSQTARAPGDWKIVSTAGTLDETIELARREIAKAFDT